MSLKCNTSLRNAFYAVCLIFLPGIIGSVNSQNTRPKIFAEFGRTNCEEALAYIDLLSQTALENPNDQFYIFVYEGKEDIFVYDKKRNESRKTVLPRRGLAKAVITSIKKRLEFQKRLNAQYVFIEGGFRNRFTVEVFKVPTDEANKPKPSPMLDKMKYRPGKAKGFCTECCI